MNRPASHQIPRIGMGTGAWVLDCAVALVCAVWCMSARVLLRTCVLPAPCVQCYLHSFAHSLRSIIHSILSNKLSTSFIRSFLLTFMQKCIYSNMQYFQHAFSSGERWPGTSVIPHGLPLTRNKRPTATSGCVVHCSRRLQVNADKRRSLSSFNQQSDPSPPDDCLLRT